MIVAGIPRTPSSLGIAGFDAFRPAQIAALERIAASNARVVMVQAPTGSGKSLIARAAGAVLGMHATYYSTTTQLQAQFCRDFQDAVELRGRANYRTENGPFPAVTCDDCDWREGRGCSWCDSRRSCPYRVQKQKAIEAPFAVLNTAYFLAEANTAGGFSDEERLLVIDEADALESQLLEAVCVKLTDLHLQRLRLPSPRLTERPEEEDWTSWADQAATAVRLEARQLEREAAPCAVPALSATPALSAGPGAGRLSRPTSGAWPGIWPRTPGAGSASRAATG